MTLTLTHGRFTVLRAPSAFRLTFCEARFCIGAHTLNSFRSLPSVVMQRIRSDAILKAKADTDGITESKNVKRVSVCALARSYAN